MRVELLLLLSLACLAFTAQAAPASVSDALLQQRDKKHHNGKSKQHGSESPQHHHHHHKQSVHSAYGGNSKRTRALEGEGLKAAQEAKSVFMPSIESKLHAKLDGMEKAGITKEKNKLHEIQIADTAHIAKHGGTPPKFPTVTRIGSTIGLSAAVFNVFNFIFSAKTTALATDQFSAPPTPPTLLDTAGRWDGQQYHLMPLPDNSNDGKARRRKRSLQHDSAPVIPAKKRMIRRRRPQHLEHASLPAEHQHDPKLSKRWMTAAVVGLVAGAALSPGMPLPIIGKHAEVDPPPFDPYDPDILKPKDPFAVAAANPGQALPAIPATKAPQISTGVGNPALGNVVFPASAYTSSDTDVLKQQQQQQQLANDAGARQRGTVSSMNPSDGGSTSAASVDDQAVLRKRAVVSNKIVDGELDNTKLSAPLEKRFLFGKGPWGRMSGGAAAAGVAYVLYMGVTHARHQQMNPRDRDILKDLDDTPMYGAVGVPKRVPGQLATNAMPGYSDYVAQLQAQQAQRQAQRQAQQQAQVQQQQLPATQAQAREALTAQAVAAQSASGGQGSASAEAAGNDPVLRRRSVDQLSSMPSHLSPRMFGDASQTRLEKRGKWLIGGGLAAVGLALGYLQSATQFPQDRDEEKDERKRKQKKEQEQQLAMQQQQALAAQGAQAGGASYAPTSAGGAPSDSFAQPMPGADTSAQSFIGNSGGGIVYPNSAYGSAGGVASPVTGAGTTYGSGGASTGGVSSASAALNAAAGYSSSGDGGGSGSILRKREASTYRDQDLKARSLSKRTPGVGSFITIAGTTLFLGTLAGNVFVGERQKSKPVPLVTPNADTRGPMIPGGDLYTQYLASKRPPPSSDTGSVGANGDAGDGGGIPASINGQAMTPAAASAANIGQASIPESQPVAASSANPLISASSAVSDSAGASGGADPVLKKRSALSLNKRTLPAMIEAESVAAGLLSKGGLLSEAGSGAASLLGKGAAVSEAGAGAASALSKGAAISEAGAASRFAPLGLRTGAAASEAGVAGLGRASMAGESSAAAKFFEPNAAAVGSARPAMLSDLGGASGRAGMPATMEGAGLAESATARQFSREEILETERKMAAARAAGLPTAENGLAEEAATETAKKKGWTLEKSLGVVGSASGASMVFNGVG